MNKVLTICIVIIFSFSSFAGQLTKLQKGDKAPYDGILADSKQMKNFRKIEEERKLLELKNIKLSELGKIKDNKIDLYQKDLSNTHKEFAKYKTKTFFTNTGYFVLGVILTGFAAKAAIESTR